MAQIYKNKNSLETKIEDNKTYFLQFLIFDLFILFVAPPLAVILFMIYCFLISGTTKQKRIYKSGLAGEEYAIRELSKLDDTYSVFCDLTIPFDGKTSQIDTVVVGDNGVFVTEIKNIKGQISGDINDHNLNVEKTGRKGGVYHKDMYNPHKQSKTHVYRLSNFLKEKRVNVWVESFVFFKPINSYSGEKRVLNVSGAEGIMFDNSDELLTKIKSVNRTIRKEDKLEIIRVLSEILESNQE